MPRIGLYTATENELGALARAAGEVETDLVVRSESDLDEPEAVEAFCEELADCDVVVLWLHGGEDSMPGYDRVVDRCYEAGVPVVVKRPATPSRSRTRPSRPASERPSRSTSKRVAALTWRTASGI